MSAVSGAFVVLGARDSANYAAALVAFDQGQTEWVSHLVDVGEMLESYWELAQSAYPNETDFVWDYEISEQIGAFIADYTVKSQGELPDKAALREKIHSLLDGLGYPLAA